MRTGNDGWCSGIARPTFHLCITCFRHRFDIDSTYIRHRPHGSLHNVDMYVVPCDIRLNYMYLCFGRQCLIAFVDNMFNVCRTYFKCMLNPCRIYVLLMSTASSLSYRRHPVESNPHSFSPRETPGWEYLEVLEPWHRPGLLVVTASSWACNLQRYIDSTYIRHRFDTYST